MFDRHSLSPIDYCICLLWKRVFSRWICALSFLHFWCHSFLFILPVQKTRFPVLTWRHVFSFTNSRIRLRKLAPPRRPTTSANQSLGPIFQVFAVAIAKFKWPRQFEERHCAILPIQLSSCLNSRFACDNSFEFGGQTVYPTNVDKRHPTLCTHSRRLMTSWN